MGLIIGLVVIAWNAFDGWRRGSFYAFYDPGLRNMLLVPVLVVTVLGALLTAVVRFVSALVAGLRSPVDDAVAATPQSVLRGDRVVAMTVGLAIGLVFGLIGLWMGGVEGGVVIGAAAGVVVGPGRTSWGQCAVARAWLAAHRRLPLRLMAFLDDAHQRGVLRQAGAVYQFRHALLQDHLADGSPTSQTDR